MANFDTLLKGLHTNYQVTETINESSPCLEVNSKRQFTPINNFDTVIGYEGDVNSQVILFKLPDTYDNHKLSECQTKLVKWKNLTSGIEGTSDLTYTETIESDKIIAYYKWEVDSEIYARAGSIEISLAFEDRKDNKKDGLLAYAWNTSLYTGLSVGKTITSVGGDLPAQNEILIIDRETRKIIAPPGYNNLVCNRGEVGMGKLYFLINDYLGKGKSVQGTKITLYITVNGKVFSRFEDIAIESIWRDYYSSLSENMDKLYLLEWELPSDVTMNVEGAFGISIEIAKITDGSINWRWVSSPYTSLSIGKSDLTAEDVPVTPSPSPTPGGGGGENSGLTITEVTDLINKLVPEMIDSQTQGTIDKKVSESIETGVKNYFEDSTKSFVWKA